MEKSLLIPKGSITEGRKRLLTPNSTVAEGKKTSFIPKGNVIFVCYTTIIVPDAGVLPDFRDYNMWLVGGGGGGMRLKIQSSKHDMT